MAKQRKIAYGVAEDGVSLKIAGLKREGSQISLQALEQIELERSLYQHPDEKTPDSVIAAPEDINLDDFTADNVTTFRVKPYETLFQTYSLNQGILAINTFEEQIIKVPINSPDITQKQKTKLVKENIPREDFKAGLWQSSVVTINDQPELWIHHGTNSLLEILEDTASANSMKFFYQLSDANETALANLFIHNQPAESMETYMVLYLGNEYRHALLFEGNKWTFSLPVHISQHQSDIDIIYSKLSLAMDEAHITDPKNLLICGDYSNDDTVAFLRNQLPNTNVDMWTLPTLYLDAETTQVYDTAQIARFMLPIALAWKALYVDNTLSIKTNFLPSYIIEGQKVFKIAWHGYIILLLLFSSSLFLTKTLYRLQFELQQTKFKNKELFTDYTAKKDQAEKMMKMAKAIDIQTANIEVIKSLLVGKNPWTEVISRLNDCFESHPVSWLTNLRKNTTGFQITGVTTDRANVVVFSNLFPKGIIAKVFNRKIHSFSVWEFEISYSYPEVNWYEMMEADVQQLKIYRDQKTEKAQQEAQASGKLKEKAQSKGSDSGQGTASKSENIKQPAPQNDNQESEKVLIIDAPTPPKSLLSDKDDPVENAYLEFQSAFKREKTSLMVDLGVKFINNYPNHALTSYVRWYLSYRAWQTKDYKRTVYWLDPMIKKQDATKPYALLLSGAIYRDWGDRAKAEELWNTLIQDYPQHQVTKTARKFLNEKH